MKTTFLSKKLESLANDFKKCQKELGQTRAELYNQRLSDLLDADTLEDVGHLPSRYHELTNNCKGQWALQSGSTLSTYFSAA